MGFVSTFNQFFNDILSVKMRDILVKRNICSNFLCIIIFSVG